MKYILLGGNGYYGRNFQFYLMNEGQKVIVVDKDIPFNNNGTKYYKYNLTQDVLPLFRMISENEEFSENVRIINFAAMSFVDDSISNPNECINNNTKCLDTAMKLYTLISEKTYCELIHISTDEVNVVKPDKNKSPYVKSKLICEDMLLNSSGIEYKILRPVNLMGYCFNKKIPALRQKNECLLKKIICKPDIIYIHGSGTQRRMFMTMTDACEVLFNLFKFNSNSRIIDITDYKFRKYRTLNLQIKDIVIYLSKYYGFKYEYVEDPRGVFQDFSYSFEDEKEIDKMEIEHDLEKIKLAL